MRRLSDAGATVRVASRHPAQDEGDNVEQVVADAHDERSVEAAVAGADGIVNAISLYVEHGAGTFHSVHVEATARIARVARQAGVKRFVHVSGIGADALSPSPYIHPCHALSCRAVSLQYAELQTFDFLVIGRSPTLRCPLQRDPYMLVAHTNRNWSGSHDPGR